jgi:hypothetical protein
MIVAERDHSSEEGGHTIPSLNATAVLEYKQLYLDRGTALYVSIPLLLFLMGPCSFLVESEGF